MNTEKIKEFFIIWGIVLFLNQTFLFGGCFNPTCIGAALPHTGIIAWLIMIWYGKDDDSIEEIDDSDFIVDPDPWKPKVNPTRRKREEEKKPTEKKHKLNPNWDKDFRHKKTGVHYVKYEFDINGWSTIKLYLPSSKTFEYINIHTGDKYNRADLDYYGNQKYKKQNNTQKVKTDNKNTPHTNWDKDFRHKKTGVLYIKQEFDINGWSTIKVYLPSSKTFEYINMYTGDKYGRAGMDYYGQWKQEIQEQKEQTKREKKHKPHPNWDKDFRHKKTGVLYIKHEFDINGWSTIKLYLPYSRTFEYINIHTGDKYNRAGVDYYGEKKEEWTEKTYTRNNTTNKESFTKKFGDAYERYIGKKFEDKGDIVIYNGFIKGYEDKGVDIIVISKETKVIDLIQCKNWVKKEMVLNDIEDIHHKLSIYELDFFDLTIDDINKHLHYKLDQAMIKNIFLTIKLDSKRYKIRKSLYASSDKVIDLEIGKHLTYIKPNIFRFQDMKIVIHKPNAFR